VNRVQQEHNFIPKELVAYLWVNVDFFVRHFVGLVIVKIGDNVQHWVRGFFGVDFNEKLPAEVLGSDQIVATEIGMV